MKAVLALAMGAAALAPSQPKVAKKMASDAAAAVLAAGTVLGGPVAAHAITSDVRNQLSYEQVKGTGLANRCNEVQGKDSITVSGKMQMVDFCLEPKTWQVEEEVANKKGDVTKQFVNTKLMTRQTYTLDGISGKLEGGGGITFTEEDGIDYAPTTVQLPGGERVPFLFTIKELVAKGSGGAFKPGYEFGGSFKVPSYRTGLFLDPKGRGMTTGYDQAQALIASQTGDAALTQEVNNFKKELADRKAEEEMKAQVQIQQPQLQAAPAPGQPATEAAAAAVVSAAPPAAKGLDPVHVRKQLAAMVKDAVASDEDLELDSPFMDAGMDSLSSVALMSMVAKEFQMALSPSLVFDFPTLRAMEEHLVQESQG